MGVVRPDLVHKSCRKLPLRVRETCCLRENWVLLDDRARQTFFSPSPWPTSPVAPQQSSCGPRRT
jgi:hypothetical protein